MSFARELWRGKDLYRLLLNQACASQVMRGVTFDIGGGAVPASYRRFLQRRPDTTIQSFDLIFAGKSGGAAIDLESMPLPAPDGTVDTALLFNVLEHLRDYRHILMEIARALAPGGQVLGAVPFLVGYHPDPHDYWRFTRESLQDIFTSAGFTRIGLEAIGTGPFGAAWAQIEWLCPRLLKYIFLPIVLGLDRLVGALRPGRSPDRSALGFFFILKK